MLQVQSLLPEKTLPAQEKLNKPKKDTNKNTLAGFNPARVFNILFIKIFSCCFVKNRLYSFVRLFVGHGHNH